MTINLSPTSKIVELNGVPARVWEGMTDTGVKCFAFVTRIGCDQNADQSEFQKALSEVKAPSAEIASFPLRMVI